MYYIRRFKFHRLKVRLMTGPALLNHPANPLAKFRGNRLPSICFVAQYAYGAMMGGSGGHMGGIERQQSLMARWLAAHGFQVSMLTWDEGQADELVADGVRLIKLCQRNEGIPGLRFFHPRWTSLYRALRIADADIYYHNSAEYVTGQVAAWCRRHRRKFVYSVASDPACDTRLPTLPKVYERAFYRYGIHRADRVIVQTRLQQQMLRAGFGLDSVIVNMPCPGPSASEYEEPRPPAPGQGCVLWVGRMSPVKRIELLLDVAAAIPEIRFVLAGGAEFETPYSRGILARARTMSNVTLMGRVARDLMPKVYREASCLISTSSHEGLPNTFLEAWSYGLPVVSTVDPDRLISEKALGVVAADRDGLIDGIRYLIEDPTRWIQASRNARRYYTANHTIDESMRRFQATFLDLLGTP